MAQFAKRTGNSYFLSPLSSTSFIKSVARRVQVVSFVRLM